MAFSAINHGMPSIWDGSLEILFYSSSSNFWRAKNILANFYVSVYRLRSLVLVLITCFLCVSPPRFLLKDGQLWLCAPQAKQIWKCLAENAVYLCDREACFKWYSKLMGDEPDLDPDINKDFFENNVLQLDPSLLTENGMKCFERFFKAVNCREGKLVAKRRAYMMDDLELIGLDYLWRVSVKVSKLGF